MQAYENGLKQSDTRMVLKPDSSFFRYFNDPLGKPRDNSTAGPAVPAPSR
jgi:membrane protease subunit HflC